MTTYKNKIWLYLILLIHIIGYKHVIFENKYNNRINDKLGL